ncbi:GNAT family N-acetyltransferase [Maricaulaceae bacterium NA33B04]|nr:GNAT family N-acetyltransferase [Maricaulaceae bacterium NA33B04]
MLDQEIETHAAQDADIMSVIETERLVLTPLAVEDADWVSRESGKPEVARNLALVPEPNPALGVEIFILTARAREANMGDLVRAVRLKDGTPIGVIGANPRGEGVWSLGYWYKRTAWGQGYATEAGLAMIEALRQRGARQLVAGFFSHNAASARVLSKLGFERNGQDDPEFCTALLAKQAHVGMTKTL